MIYDVLANYAYMHKDIQTQDARLTAQRGRETQKTQSRLPATSLYMHCANTTTLCDIITEILIIQNRQDTLHQTGMLQAIADCWLDAEPLFPRLTRRSI